MTVFLFNLWRLKLSISLHSIQNLSLTLFWGLGRFMKNYLFWKCYKNYILVNLHKIYSNTHLYPILCNTIRKLINRIKNFLKKLFLHIFHQVQPFFLVWICAWFSARFLWVASFKTLTYHTHTHTSLSLSFSLSPSLYFSFFMLYMSLL